MCLGSVWDRLEILPISDTGGTKAAEHPAPHECSTAGNVRDILPTHVQRLQ